MKASFIRAATAATLALAVGAFAHAQNQETNDTKTAIKEDAKAVGHAVADGARTVGPEVAEKSKEAGHAVATRTRPAREKIRDKSKEAGHAVADTAKSVGKSVEKGADKVKKTVTGKSEESQPKS